MQVPKVHVDEILSIVDKYTNIHINGGSPGGSVAKESACSAGDLGSTLGQEDPLEKGMETHSSILAWRIPQTEDPGGLLSMGSQNQT